MDIRHQLSRRKVFKGMFVIMLSPSILAVGGCNGPLKYRDELNLGYPGTTIRPDVIGELLKADTESLWKLYNLIGEKWGMNQFEQFGQSEFSRFVSVKTNSIPSYLGEYENAIKITSGIDNLELFNQRFNNLFPHGSENLKDSDSAVWHFRKFVLSQFIQLHLVIGGFKRFGIKGYPGHMGGPFADAKHLPYR